MQTEEDPEDSYEDIDVIEIMDDSQSELEQTRAEASSRGAAQKKMNAASRARTNTPVLWYVVLVRPLEYHKSIKQ